MKTSAIIRIVIYSILILVLIGIMGGFIEDDLYLSSGMEYHETDAPVPTEAARSIEQQEISTQIQNIEIEWAAGSITIHRSDSLDSIIIEEASINDSEHKMVCRQLGQTLKIQYCEEKVSLIGINDNTYLSKDLVIRVPKNWNCNSLEIDAAATDVEVHDLTINELDFDGASGRLTLENCEIVELDIDTASGDVEFTGNLKELDFDAASARFYGEFYQIPNRLDLDAMSGDLELVLPAYSGFYLEMETLSGSFDSDFDFHTIGAHYECGDGACKINVNAVSGDISILKGVSEPKNCDH